VTFILCFGIRPSRWRVATRLQVAIETLDSELPASATSSPPRPIPARFPSARTPRRNPARPLHRAGQRLSPFTAPRLLNRRTWTYRIRPSVMHKPYERICQRHAPRSGPFNEGRTHAQSDALGIPSHSHRTNRLRRRPHTLGGNGDLTMHSGVAIHIYAANKSMTDRFFYNADGEMLFVPQQGACAPHRTAASSNQAPAKSPSSRAASSSASNCLEEKARGYICENYGQPFRLPDLGPIGANGLANSRDFLTPTPPTTTATTPFRGRRQIPRQPLGHRLRPLAARRRRLARQLRALQVRPGPLQLHQHGQLRPSRSIDLHRAHLAQRDPRHRQRGLRHLPAALDGRRAHLPPALVPPQLDERVHGPDLRRVRRQGRRLRARRSQPAQLHVRPRPRRRNLRARQQRRTEAASNIDGTLAFMFETRNPSRRPRRPIQTHPQRSPTQLRPLKQFDYELELALYIGEPNPLGSRSPSPAPPPTSSASAPQRLVRPRHPILGVPAPRPIPRQKLRHHHLAPGSPHGRARSLPRSPAPRALQTTPPPLPRSAADPAHGN
jgi:hypothetical protein